MAMITNDCNMSPALFAAVKRVREQYSRSGYLSTTSCIDSPRIRVLEQRHDNEIVVPASTLIPSFIGTCVHDEIAKYEKGYFDGVIQEEEFVIDVLGIKFSGRPDIYHKDEEEVGDEKTTSVWTYTYNPDGKSEHVKQININGYLIRQLGFPCKKGWVELIFLDWKLSESKRNPRYPRRVERVVMSELWNDQFTRSFIEKRVTDHLNAEKERDEHLPPCTPDEQWQKPSGFAVYKGGNVRATKVYDTYDDAVTGARIVGRGARIEERKGERTRCENYCLAKPWCNQYLEESRVQG